jgi:hypothetical protein
MFSMSSRRLISTWLGAHVNGRFLDISRAGNSDIPCDVSRRRECTFVQCMFGITNSAPARIPVGQRLVIVFNLV